MLSNNGFQEKIKEEVLLIKTAEATKAEGGSSCEPSPVSIKEASNGSEEESMKNLSQKEMELINKFKKIRRDIKAEKQEAIRQETIQKLEKRMEKPAKTQEPLEFTKDKLQEAVMAFYDHKNLYIRPDFDADLRKTPHERKKALEEVLVFCKVHLNKYELSKYSQEYIAYFYFRKLRQTSLVFSYTQDYNAKHLHLTSSSGNQTKEDIFQALRTFYNSRKITNVDNIKMLEIFQDSSNGVLVSLFRSVCCACSRNSRDKKKAKASFKKGIEIFLDNPHASYAEITSTSDILSNNQYETMEDDQKEITTDLLNRDFFKKNRDKIQTETFQSNIERLDKRDLDDSLIKGVDQPVGSPKALTENFLEMVIKQRFEENQNNCISDDSDNNKSFTDHNKKLQTSDDHSVKR